MKTILSYGMGCAGSLSSNDSANKETQMEIGDPTSIYNLLCAIGDILTTTWPDRLVFGEAVGLVIAWLARL